MTAIIMYIIGISTLIFGVLKSLQNAKQHSALKIEKEEMEEQLKPFNRPNELKSSNKKRKIYLYIILAGFLICFSAMQIFSL